MSVSQFITHFNQYIPLKAVEKAELRDRVMERKVKRRQFILQQNGVCKHYVFVLSESFKMYAVDNRGRNTISSLPPRMNGDAKFVEGGAAVDLLESLLDETILVNDSYVRAVAAGDRLVIDDEVIEPVDIPFCIIGGLGQRGKIEIANVLGCGGILFGPP